MKPNKTYWDQKLPTPATHTAIRHSNFAKFFTLHSTLCISPLAMRPNKTYWHLLGVKIGGLPEPNIFSLPPTAPLGRDQARRRFRVPEGPPENSPTIHRWVPQPQHTSPEGTAEIQLQPCDQIKAIGTSWDQTRRRPRFGGQARRRPRFGGPGRGGAENLKSEI